MTLASSEQMNRTPWFAQAGAACSIIPVSRAVSETAFSLKPGGYCTFFKLTGMDEEGLTDGELESRMRTLEGAFRGLPEGACLYQYTRVRSGCDVPRQEKYDHPVTESFVRDRLEFLNETANFRRIDLHWCLTFEPAQASGLSRKPKEEAGESAKLLSNLQKSATILVSHLSSTIGLEQLGKEQAFQFLSYLFNLEDWAEEGHLRSDTGVDRQIVKSTIRWHEDHLKVGKRHVQMFSLQAPPEASRPCLFSGLASLDCDSILCTSWRPKSTTAARKEIDQQEKFISFFKVGVVSRLMAGKDTASLDTGAAAKAANSSVDDLSEVIRSLDKKGQGEFSARLLISARTAGEVHDVVPAVHRVFVDARAQVMEETLGNLSAFFAMFPGNHKYNVFPLWMGEDHHARLSSVFAPHVGHPTCEDLNDLEYLNVLETRSGTPFYQDVYVGGVRVMLIIGPPGTGKSVHGNQLISLEQKYNGFTYIFDIGGSYESVVELYGGKVDKVGKDGPRVNPFALEPTESNVAFLYTFVKLLLTSGGATLAPEDDDVIFHAVQGVYLLDRENRRLSNLILPRHLQRYLGKWIGNGVYNAVFDNVEDSLSLSRLQCFDFQGVSKQYADLIEPLMIWLLRRVDDVVHNPANLGVPKHVLIEEIFSNMKNEQLLQGALDSIKTVRKNLGGVTMIGQSADDLGENASLIVNSCSSFLFLKDATFDRERYGKLFKLNEQQLDLFESLRDREGLYVRRDGLTKVVTLNLDKRSYAKFSTRPKDKLRRLKLIERYGLEEGIERFAQGEAV